VTNTRAKYFIVKVVKEHKNSTMCYLPASFHSHDVMFGRTVTFWTRQPSRRMLFIVRKYVKIQ